MIGDVRRRAPQDFSHLAPRHTGHQAVQDRSLRALQLAGEGGNTRGTHGRFRLLEAFRGIVQRIATAQAGAFHRIQKAPTGAQDEVLFRASDAHVQEGQGFQHTDPGFLEKVIRVFTRAPPIVGGHFCDSGAQGAYHGVRGLRIPAPRLFDREVHPSEISFNSANRTTGKAARVVGRRRFPDRDFNGEEISRG